MHLTVSKQIRYTD